MERKKIKPNKYQLKLYLTGSIWLAEDYPVGPKAFHSSFDDD